MEIYEILNDYDFKEFSDRIMKDGEISAKVKRLIAIASAVAVGCEYCVNHHIKLARDEGISKKEIIEAILVASLVRFGSGVRFIASGDIE